MYLDSGQGMSWSPHDKGIIVRRTDSNGGNDNTMDQVVDDDVDDKTSERQTESNGTKWYARIPQIFCCRSGQIKDQRQKKCSPYALYMNENLSPRSSSWVYLASCSLAGLATVLIIEQPLLNENDRNGPDTILISILSVSFALSSIIAISYRHRVLRDFLTKDILPCTSLELLFSIAVFILWCVELRYVMDPFSGVEYGLTLTNEKSGDHYSELVWNDNLWLISWLGGGVISFLLGELVLSSSKKRRGIIERNIPRNTRLESTKHADGVEYMRTYMLGEDGSTKWFLILVSSCALTAFCIDYRVGVSCEGTLGSTPFCTRCVLGLTTGILCAIISVGALGLHFVNQHTKENSPEQTSHCNLWILEAIFASLSFILNSINIGFITSPGGPGAEICNIFVTAWLGLIISLFTCVEVEKGRILRVIELDEAEKANVEYLNHMTYERDMNMERDHFCKAKHPKKQERDNNMEKSNRKHKHTTRAQREQAYKLKHRKTGHKNEYYSEPQRAFISKVPKRRSSSSSDSSESSSSNSNSVSLTETPPNDKSMQRMDTDGERTSGATSTYSLPLPPPICLDSSSDDHCISQPSLSPPLNSINGGHTTPHAVQKTIKSSPTPPPPPYNAYGFSKTLDNPNLNLDYFSIEKEDDDDSAIEICADHPDDVSSLGISMLSLGQSGHSAADPDGYKSEDNYIVPPQANKTNRNSYDRRPSRVKRLMSDDLPTVEEQSYSTTSKIDTISVDDNAEEIMNLGRKPEDGTYSRLSSGNESSIGPITVDESVSHANE